VPNLIREGTREAKRKVLSPLILTDNNKKYSKSKATLVTGSGGL
jgi:hypothetical protein